VTIAAPQLLDLVFSALADATRRSILLRLRDREATVSELAEPLAMSLPAVSKHLRVLEEAGLLERRIEGRSHFLKVNTEPLNQAVEWIEHHRKFWESSFDRLEKLLKKSVRTSKSKTKPKR
jgi:DNA-binding transcriptional ArsR family regulator